MTKPSLIQLLVILLLAPHLGTASLNAQVRGLTPLNEREQQFAQGEKFAVVIGVNVYADESIPKLRYCVSDAHQVGKVLVNRCGYPSDNIMLLTDTQPLDARPNRSIVGRTLRQTLGDAGPGDTVMVYFSGHGFVQDGQGFLGTADCYRDELSETALPIGDVRRWLSECRAREKLLVLDCCHAATKSDPPAGASSERLARFFETSHGTITLASCGANERSFEWSEVEQGVFSYFFCRGLEFDADYDKNNIVDSGEIYKFVFESIKKTGHKQTPRQVISPDVEGVFLLAKVFEGGEVEPPFYLGQPLTARAIEELPPLRPDFNFPAWVTTPAFKPLVRPDPVGRPAQTTAFAVLGTSRANAAQERRFREAEKLAGEVSDPYLRSMVWLALARSRCIVADKVGYAHAISQQTESFSQIESNGDAIQAAWRTAQELTRLGDAEEALRALAEAQQRIGGFESAYGRYVWLARLGGLAVRLEQPALASELVKSAQQTIKRGGIHSHVAIRQDHQHHAIVIASCHAHDLKQAVAMLPNAFAKYDKARYAAVCEIAVAAAVLGDAKLYGTYRAAASAMTESRRNNDPFRERGRSLATQALAYAGHVEEAIKEVGQIADENLREAVWLTIVDVQAVRAQTDDAMANLEHIVDNPQSPLSCCFLSESATSIRKIEKWQRDLPAAQRAGALAGLAQRGQTAR